MKFYLLKISAFAATFACSVSAKESEMPQLRGAVTLADGSGVVANAVKMNRSSFDRSNKNSLSGSSSSLIPEEMDEEDEDKQNAAQKRQDQRDNRRSRDNPNRSQDDEQGERERKNNQASNRSHRCTDPSEPGCGDDDYPRSRENDRQYRCDDEGRSCGYRRVHPEDEPNRRRAATDSRCMSDCDDAYSNDEAYENCIRRRCALELIKFTEEDFNTLFADEDENSSTRNLLPNDPEDEEMDEEDEEKQNAAQKRQDQRDNRRSRDNPNRSQDDEQGERERKSNQASNRSHRCTDPSEPGCGNDDYPRSRENDRQYRCDDEGRSCGYRRVHPEDEPNRRRAATDSRCMSDCDDAYSNDEAYENCIRRRCDLQLIDFNKLAMFKEVKEEVIVAEE